MMQHRRGRGGDFYGTHADWNIYDNDILIGVTNAYAYGEWTFKPKVALTDGVHTFTAAEVGIGPSGSWVYPAAESWTITVQTEPSTENDQKQVTIALNDCTADWACEMISLDKHIAQFDDNRNIMAEKQQGTASLPQLGEVLEMVAGQLQLGAPQGSEPAAYSQSAASYEMRPVPLEQLISQEVHLI